MAYDEQAGGPGDAFEFTGTWRDYLPIALSNLALTIVTLGIYRFWAKARERRYLWSHTRFIDDRLEWTGTGKEMFIGFLVVMAIVILPLLFLNFGFQAMILRGHVAPAVLIFIAIYLFLMYLAGLARFRALRYRLSRTFWHGIRGGTDENGFAYGWSAVWKPIAGALALGALIPWSMCALWNERWNAMSFGRDTFRADANFSSLMLRWLLLLFSPIILMIVMAIIGVTIGASMGAAGVFDRFDSEDGIVAGIIIAVLFVFAIYGIVALVGLGYYAAFLREAIGATRLGTLEFEFRARSKDWLLLFLGDIALLVLTLGIGIAFLGYRHWSFFIRHLGASGEVDLSTTAQSATHAPREAEGFADAFDIGAI